MSFLDHYHQRTGFLLFILVELVGGSLPGVADFPCNQIGDQQVIELRIIATKGEDNMPPSLKSIDNLCQPIARGAVHKVGSVHQPAKFAAQTFRCHHIYACFICPGFHAIGGRMAFPFLILLGCFSAHLHECHEPILTKTGLQGVERGGGGFLEVKGLAKL